jgi:hypothetical protein
MAEMTSEQRSKSMKRALAMCNNSAILFQMTISRQVTPLRTKDAASQVSIQTWMVDRTLVFRMYDPCSYVQEGLGCYNKWPQSNVAEAATHNISNCAHCYSFEPSVRYLTY